MEKSMTIWSASSVTPNSVCVRKRKSTIEAVLIKIHWTDFYFIPQIKRNTPKYGKMYFWPHIAQNAETHGKCTRRKTNRNLCTSGTGSGGIAVQVHRNKAIACCFNGFDDRLTMGE